MKKYFNLLLKHWLITSIIVSSAFYFGSVGTGFGIYYWAFHNIYNMTTGCSLDDTVSCNTPGLIIRRLMCYNDQGGSFYLGCPFIGMIVLLIIGIKIGVIVFTFRHFCRDSACCNYDRSLDETTSKLIINPDSNYPPYETL